VKCLQFVKSQLLFYRFSLFSSLFILCRVGLVLEDTALRDYESTKYGMGQWKETGLITPATDGAFFITRMHQSGSFKDKAWLWSVYLATLREVLR
jgi:hypothetical protein